MPSPLELYLHDHMGGATLGSELADRICERSEGAPLEDLIRPVAREIEEDRETLDGLMDALDVGRNPVKQAGGWVAEKLSRLKFSGATSGDPSHGNFMALETLALGVLGKRSLWVALGTVQQQHEAMRELDLDGLIARADGQYEVLERARIQAASELLAGGSPWAENHRAGGTAGRR